MATSLKSFSEHCTLVSASVEVDSVKLLDRAWMITLAIRGVDLPCAISWLSDSAVYGEIVSVSAGDAPGVLPAIGGLIDRLHSRAYGDGKSDVAAVGSEDSLFGELRQQVHAGLW
mgnify:CR=1 FL=1